MSGATDPAACLFCDDSVKNIQAASAFGWRTARRCRRDVAEMSPRYRRGAARDAAERQPGLIQPRHAPRQRAGASARECARIAAGSGAYTSARALGDPPRDMSTRALRPSSARCWWGGRTETRARRCGAPRRTEAHLASIHGLAELLGVAPAEGQGADGEARGDVCFLLKQKVLARPGAGCGGAPGWFLLFRLFTLNETGALKKEARGIRQRTLSTAGVTAFAFAASAAECAFALRLAATTPDGAVRSRGCPRRGGSYAGRCLMFPFFLPRVGLVRRRARRS